MSATTVATLQHKLHALTEQCCLSLAAHAAVSFITIWTQLQQTAKHGMMSHKVAALSPAHTFVF